MNQKKAFLLACTDILTVFLILYALIVMYCGLDIGVLFSAAGAAMLRYYTVDANFLLGFSCLLCLPFDIRALTGSRREIPLWANLFKFTGVLCTTVTFLVVVCFLWPMFGWKPVSEGSNLFMHFVIPVLGALVYILSREAGRIPRRLLPAAVFPTFLYALVYMIRILQMETVSGGPHGDWYGFARWGKGLCLPLFAAAVLLSYGIAWLLWKAGGGHHPGAVRGASAGGS